MRNRISGFLFVCAVSALCVISAAVFPDVATAGTAGNRQVGVVPAAVQVPNADKNWLVSVGINHYDEERVNALQFCRADAEAIHTFFTQSGVVPETNAYLLISGHPNPRFQPTRLNILESVQYVAREAGPDSTIILFFAGHGFVDTDGKSYLLPQDGKVSLLRDTAVLIDRINEILRESASKRKVVFMDACRNAPVRDGRGAVDEKRTRIFLEALKASAGQVTFAACNAGESSFEDAETGHGVFTLHVLRGLQGEAQADPNGLINVTTLQHYLSQKVPAWALKRRKPVQHPWMWGEMSVPIPLAVAGRGPILVGVSGSVTPTPLSQHTPPPVVTPFVSRFPYFETGWAGMLSVTVAFILLASTAVFLSRRRKRKAAAASPKSVDSETARLFPVVAQKPPEAAPSPCAEISPQGRHSPLIVSAPLSPHAEARYPGDVLPEPLERARLVFESPESARKILFLTKPRLAVGVNKFTKDPRVDLTLRFLPCRSKEQDTENWLRNRLISSPHFTIEARDDHFAIRDEIGSKNGTSLIDLRGGEDDPAHSVGDTETMFETPSIMEELGEVSIPRDAAHEENTTLLPKGSWAPLVERCGISIGQRVMVLHAQTFASKRLGLYALRLKRTDNFPFLEYILLIRRAYIGSDPKCAVRVPDSSFPRLAAAIDFKKGGFFLVTGETGARVYLNRELLGKSRMVPLTHVSLIEIGDYRWRFEPATIRDFTEAFCPSPRDASASRDLSGAPSPGLA